MSNQDTTLDDMDHLRLYSQNAFEVMSDKEGGRALFRQDSTSRGIVIFSRQIIVITTLGIGYLLYLIIDSLAMGDFTSLFIMLGLDVVVILIAVKLYKAVGRINDTHKTLSEYVKRRRAELEQYTKSLLINKHGSDEVEITQFLAVVQKERPDAVTLWATALVGADDCQVEVELILNRSSKALMVKTLEIAKN